MAYIVELEPGVFLARGSGDPARTYLEENATRYKDARRATLGLAYARYFRDFPEARLKIIEEHRHD